ncbi:hypothetical protein DPMN_105336 [Dreissena polymorpha]|uniref:Uncharacterized protein n=1 Tax=Dreissena polymorpha TaxID=45954 RepID=A0A9D4HBM1_DREPO|nr:hypothetical protein DPMN_105336 [Dreissena polymorpha]
MRSQSYDGASNMSGKQMGLASKPSSRELYHSLQGALVESRHYTRLRLDAL